MLEYTTSEMSPAKVPFLVPPGLTPECLTWVTRYFRLSSSRRAFSKSNVTRETTR